MDSVRVAILREILATSDWLARSRDFARSMRLAAREPDGLLLVGTPTDEPWHFAAHLDEEARAAQLPELRPTLLRHRIPPGAPPHLAVGLDRLEAVRRGEALVVVAPDDTSVPLLERVDDARRTGATILAVHAGDSDLDGLAHESIAVTPASLGVLPQAARAVLRPTAAPPPRLLLDPQPTSAPTGRRTRPRGEAATPLALDPDNRRGPDDRPELLGARADGPAPDDDGCAASGFGVLEPGVAADAQDLSFEAVQHLVSNAVGETPLPYGRGRLGFRDRLAQFLDLVSGPAPRRR